MNGLPPPAPAPGFWEQWRAILWLRWRLTQNQWSRHGRLDAISGSVAILLAIITVLAFSAAGFLCGRFLLAPGSTDLTVVILDGVVVFFLFFWIGGLLTEIQRSESLDLSKFLHLPVSLGNVFLFNYLSSWVSFGILVALPGLTSLAIGLSVSQGPGMLWLIPPILGFFFLTTALTYLLRGWLMALMSNERRRRAIIVAASVAAVLFFQLPNLYFNVLHQPGRSKQKPFEFEYAALVHAVLPPLWIGGTASAIDRQNYLPAAAATGAYLVMGSLALFASYQGMLRSQRGKSRAAPRKKASPVRESRMVSLDLPFVSPDVSAVTLANLRSYLRAPEVKMALFGQVVLTIAFGYLFFRRGGNIPAGLQPAFGAIIATLSLMGSTQLLFNQFGYDRNGFRSYVLAPISRTSLLFGKALAALPMVCGVATLILTATLALRFVHPLTFASGLLNLLAGYAIFSTVGNWFSIIAPYRVVAGSLKSTKAPPRVMLTVLGGMLLSAVAGSLLFLPSLFEILTRSSFPTLAPWLNLGGSAVLLALAVLVFAVTCRPLGHLLEAREKAVLAEVTREVE